MLEKEIKTLKQKLIQQLNKCLYFLKRIEFGPCKLGRLKEGQWRFLQNNEILEFVKKRFFTKYYLVFKFFF